MKHTKEKLRKLTLSKQTVKDKLFELRLAKNEEANKMFIKLQPHLLHLAGSYIDLQESNLTEKDIEAYNEKVEKFGEITKKLFMV
jgi:hypothetical protein